jgi:hypothetical protein
MKRRKRTIADIGAAGDLSTEQIDSVVSGVHILPLDQQWRVFRTGSTTNRIDRSFRTKEEAVQFALRLGRSRRIDAYLHEKSGSTEPIFVTK